MAKSMKSIIIANKSKPEVLEALPGITSIVERSTQLLKSFATDDVIDTSNVDFAVVLGGDGTMLGIVRRFCETQLPLIGVNFGKLGFLTSFTVGDVERMLPVLCQAWPEAQKFVSERNLLRVTGHTSSLAMNDLVINAGEPFRMIYIGIYIDDRKIATVGGDGIIVATPTGSTAYNLAAGGPILFPGVRGIIINPINPHALTFRPIVVDNASHIRLVAERVNPGTKAVVDGQDRFDFSEGDSILIEDAGVTAKIVMNPAHERWENITAKFKWGSLPSY